MPESKDPYYVRRVIAASGDFNDRLSGRGPIEVTAMSEITAS
jgi:hypothetical protein